MCLRAGVARGAGVLLLLLSFFNGTLVSGETPTEILDGFMPPLDDNDSVSAQIKCYGLPFGGLGILSHALTYYTMLCLGIGVRPLMPWKWLEHKKWDSFMCVASMALTVTVSALTMKSCQRSWPLLLMAGWKLLLSFSVNLVGIWRSVTLKPALSQSPIHRHAPTYVTLQHPAPPPWPPALHHLVPQRGYYLDYHSYAMLPQQKTRDPHTHDDSTRDRVQAHLDKRPSIAPMLGLLPYALGTLAGMVGLFAIVKETWSDVKDVRLTTIIFVVLIVLVMAGVVGLLGFCCWCSPCVSVPLGLGVGFATLLIVVVFYSDLILAAVEGNWIGLPSGGPWELEATYWVYYVGKRLPMLSF